MIKIYEEIKYYIKGKNDSILFLYRNINFFLSLIIWNNLYFKIKKKFDLINTVMHIKLYFKKALLNIKILFIFYILEYIFIIIYKWNTIFINISFILHLGFFEFKYLFLVLSFTYLFNIEPKINTDEINIEMTFKNNKGKINKEYDYNLNNNNNEYELIDNIVNKKYVGIKNE